jgi:putative PIN family toxin of toxin-antitoxin system
MIVVLDTNIWISALFFGGRPEQALIRAFEEADVAICRQIVEEITDVAVRKFAQQFAAVESRLDQLLVAVTFVEVKGVLRICRDPDDNIILECARNAGAHIIVTGDQDLLQLRQFEGTSIINADEYLGLHN